ncbi:hypothetical protein M758_1G284500 [Ceratodon purpureus]|nr:hypothetical protein M758_1G284500 [Ceratodon purpureus]
MSTMRRRVMSIVEEQGVHSSPCGYCKSPSSTSVAQRLWAHTLTVDDYQELLNRGWRRSGMVLYKNNMHQSCCPPLSIRLNVNAFRISKDQARVMRRMQRYLEGSCHGSRLHENSHAGSSNATETHNKELDGEAIILTRKKGIAHDAPEFDSPSTAKKKKTSEAEAEVEVQLTASIKDAITKCVETGSFPRGLALPQITVRKMSQKIRDKLKPIEGQFEYTSSIAFAIAAAIKRRPIKPTTEAEEEPGSDVNRLQHLSSKQEISSSLVAEILVSQLREIDGLSGYILQACKGHLNFLTIGCRAVSNSPSSGNGGFIMSPITEGTPREKGSEETGLVRPPTLPPSLPLLKPRHMTTQIKRSAFDPEEFALYRKYQMAVHNDEPEDLGESSYRRFLVDSPLIHVAPGNDGLTPSCGFGTFHQQYRIDGKLVAVGVLDVLPHCLSSYYFFWDPDLAFLSLGKYSALREIEWVRGISKVRPSLSYYYLGNYIHTCPKMRYKAAYAPSELLCPSKYIWVPYEKALPDLVSAKYTCLSHFPLQTVPSTENSAEKYGDIENMEKSSEDDVEMKSDESKDDLECLTLDGELSKIENDLPVPDSVEGDETLEKDKSHSVSIEQVVLLLDKKCLTFERLKELIEIPAADMEILTKELTLYVEGVGPDLASRMVFVSTI